MREKIKELLESNVLEDRKVGKFLLVNNFPEVKRELITTSSGNIKYIEMERVQELLDINIKYYYMNSYALVGKTYFTKKNWPELFENENKE